MSRDLTNYEYEGLVQQITDLYKDKPGFGDGYDSSTGQLLIQLLADITDNLHFMLERRSQEAFSSIARLESSVWMAASSIGYVPRRSVSAMGNLELTLKNSDGGTVVAEYDVPISYGTKVFFDGEEFIVAEDATITQGESSVQLSIKEGIQKSKSYNFASSPFFEDGFLTLENYNTIEEFSLSISGDNGERYNYVDEVDLDGFRAGALSFAPTNYPGYEIRFDRNGMRVVFGNGKFGKRPQSNVTVSWVESKGSGVSIIRTGLDFAFELDTVKDSRTTIPSKSYLYSLKNTTSINGGNNSESIEEIRDNIASFIRSNDRAVTNSDYKFRVMKSGLGAIKDVNVYGERENDSIIFTMNNVYATYVTEDQLPLNATQKRQLRDYIDRYKVNTTHVVFKEAVKTPIRLGIDFKRHPTLPISNQHLYKELLSRVDEYFAVHVGVIGKGFQYSEFVSFLQNLKINFNSITYSMTDYVYVTASAFFPFNVPTPAYDGIVELSYSYVPNATDTWSVVVDGVTYSVPVQLNDNVETLVLKMRQKIFTGTPYMVALEEPNQLRIRHPSPSGTFTVSVAAGDMTEFCIFRQLLQLPLATAGGVTGTTPQLKATTMTIKDANDVALMQDANGNGLFESLDGYFFPDTLIDYQKAIMQLPTVPNGGYYVQYQQNDFQNFDVALDGYITFSSFPSWEAVQNPEGSAVYFSYINIMD
jgi:hypothetical protein